MKDYSLENLIETFENHSKKYEMELEKYIKDWIRDNPDEDLPHHWNKEDQFNISKAFMTICKEIKDLKDASKDGMNVND